MGTLRIERVQDPVGSALMLNPQLTHIGESRVPNSIRIGQSECRARLFKHAHSGIDTVLLFDRQPAPPRPKFVRELDLPGHFLITYRMTYIVKGIPGGYSVPARRAATR